MRPVSFFMGSCALLVCSSAVVHSPLSKLDQPKRPRSSSKRMSAPSAKASPLILEKDEGERRVWRPVEGLEGQPSLFILKVDPHNGGSSHLVFGTADLPPGGKIEAHRHPGSDEILFLQNGLASVSLGDEAREVHGGATVFIPAGTWISALNTGKEAIHLVFVFSAPGFDEFMRAESVREGEKVVLLTKAEDAAILAKHKHAVIYKEP
jgi:quercetin dioxygenase-like cupin family protein